MTNRPPDQAPTATRAPVSAPPPASTPTPAASRKPAGRETPPGRSLPARPEADRPEPRRREIADSGTDGAGQVSVKGGSGEQWTPEQINELVRTVLDRLGVRMDLGGTNVAGRNAVSGADGDG